MKRLFFYACLLLGTGFSSHGQSGLQVFPLTDVRLLESPFKAAQQTDMKYLLALDRDRLLAPFLREAGLEAKVKSYGNWENSGLDGHIGGHYLSALSEMYAATGNVELKKRLDYMLDWLERCQLKNGNGYVGGIPGSRELWDAVEAGKADAGSFSLSNRWVPWYNIHKLYAGLIDAYQLTGNEQAKRILLKLSDWCLKITSGMSDAQMQQMLKTEHGGMNEVFADVAALSNDQRYLQMARRFSHRAILNPLLHHVDSLNGLHANTQIPKVIGFMRIAEVGKDASWKDAADFFWNTVVDHRTVSIGGNSVSEHFNPTNNFSSMMESREGPETCNSYNMLKLSRHLFLYSKDAKYMDYYERTTYNHILSSQHPDGGFVYFTPMRPRHYRVYSQPQEGFWCCVGSGLENHGKYGELIYAQDQEDLYVNLYLPSVLQWKARNLSVTQKTRFPFEEQSTLTVELKKSQDFAIKFRYPAWVETGKLQILVNKKAVTVKRDEHGYAAVRKLWQDGDVITVVLPMQTKAEILPDQSDWVSFVHGPIALAAITDTTGLNGLHADGSRMGHVASGPLYPIQEAPLLVTENRDFAGKIKPVKNKTFTFSAASLIVQPQYQNLELIPFYQVHDARYMIYWPFTNQAQLRARQALIKSQEEARLGLDAITVDQVSVGEQQPESDHQFKGEKTENGVFKDRHYRSAKGFFSYVLKNPDKNAVKLSFTYFDGEKKGDFDLLVNGVLLQSFKMEGKGAQFADTVLPLPDALKTQQTLEVVFKAKPGRSTSNIFELRLLDQ